MAAVTRADLNRFFTILARQLPCPVKLVLTGGIQALLLGGRRPTGDIDFGLVVSGRWSKYMQDVEAAIGVAAVHARVAVQYSADIDRWSPVAIPKARLKTRHYKRVGKLSLSFLDPQCWAVYKLARYLDSDVEDLVQVLTRQKVSALGLARLCGESLQASPRSAQLFLFKKQVEHFFREHGPRVWGKGFKGEKAIVAFHSAARIKSR